MTGRYRRGTPRLVLASWLPSLCRSHRGLTRAARSLGSDPDDLVAGQGGATTSYTFDAGDRLTQVTDSVSGTIARTYDNRFDALASETVPLGAVSSVTQ